MTTLSAMFGTFLITTASLFLVGFFWVAPAIRAACEADFAAAAQETTARQRESVRAAIAAFDEAQATLTAASDARRSAREQDLSANELVRADAGRGCALSGDDLDWLLAR